MSATLQDYLKPGRYSWSDAYHNSPHADTEEGCVVCGKRTTPANRIVVCLTGGGDVLVRVGDEQREERDNPGGFMGFWSVGSECGKAIPQEYRFNVEVTA